MNEQITAIAALLLEINGKEKYTAFFDFSGHVRTFSIRIYSGKMVAGEKTLFSISRYKTRTDSNGGIGTTRMPCPAIRSSHS